MDERIEVRLRQMEEERQARWRRMDEIRQQQARRREEEEAARWQAMLDKPNSVEALAWLQEPLGKYRSFSGGNGSDDAISNASLLRLVKRLYRYGAVKVTAIDIEFYGLPLETSEIEDTDKLVIELPENVLPENVEARRKLFSWAGRFARKEGWAPEKDAGQRYLLIWRA